MVNKAYVDNAIATGGVDLSNYYTKTQSDGRYLPLATTLNNIALPTGSVSLNS